MFDWILERSYINENGCWIWTRATVNSGYGKLKKGPTFWLAHRYVYATYIGPIGLNQVVRHKCNVKLCVNPAHLAVGTYQENYLDQIENGKSKPVRGEFKPIEYYRKVIGGGK